jgi:hypothetical protein
MKDEYEVMNWNDLKAKLQHAYPLLTSADLQWRHGTTEEMLSMIAQKLRKTYRQLVEILEKE